MPFVIVNGKVITDDTGTSMMMPVLLSQGGPLLPLIDYCLTVRRSISWQNKLLRAVKIFLEYSESNASVDEEEWKQFRNFSNALRFGTIDKNTKEDPSQLYWPAFGVNEVKVIITMLSDFFDWLGRNDYPRATKFNPQYSGSTYDQLIDRQAYLFRRDKAFLGHVWSAESPRTGRAIRGEKSPKVLPKRPPAFPENKIEELLFKGFKVAGKFDYRGMAITCLLLGGGLRVSEPFHMYLADVNPHWDDPTIPFVAVHHPSMGLAPNNWKNQSGRRGSRAEYLSSVFGLTPRNLIRGKLHAGWKNPALDERWYMQVYWFPKEFYGRLFYQLWQRYLEQVALIDRSHPFAWVNLDREPIGGIYTISQYQKALQAAVERVGLTFGKIYGTTAHGPRHAYGQRAKSAQMNEIIIQRLMHHFSPDSQLVYTQPEIKEITNAILIGSEKLAQHSNAPTHSRSLVLPEGF
ncbi:gamma-mobile-trio recombinase GmtY [Methylophilus sp. Leaf414]|uniref:gamma-mobile-trio recombinase GmtY n=1 Tax=Methylophilus sp. Leaf414 TaxID=1736371 RepID=UPI0006F5FF3F|nr:gamma-mobile-trio recombinase GmtY [Methylophilus sp. Leaf414]KQT34142.1 hypothetical protein ASG24_10355 [Methylophilus sp. Leaf414]